MLPGPTKFYECPTCKVLLSNHSLLSGNSFGEKVYSDGKRDAFMLPDFPILTKCTRCSTFVWLYKIKRIEKKTEELSKEELIDARWVDFLTIYEYLTVLKNNYYENEEEEIFIRKRILWGFNDRVREKKPIFNSKEDKNIWEANVYKLKYLIDCSIEPDDLILNAELSRNLGDFEKCKYTLIILNRPKDDWLVNAFHRECNLKNTAVFQLN